MSDLQTQDVQAPSLDAKLPRRSLITGFGLSVLSFGLGRFSNSRERSTTSQEALDALLPPLPEVELSPAPNLKSSCETMHILLEKLSIMRQTVNLAEFDQAAALATYYYVNERFGNNLSHSDSKRAYQDYGLSLNRAAEFVSNRMQYRGFSAPVLTEYARRIQARILMHEIAEEFFSQDQDLNSYLADLSPLLRSNLKALLVEVKKNQGVLVELEENTNIKTAEKAKIVNFNCNLTLHHLLKDYPEVAKVFFPLVFQSIDFGRMLTESIRPKTIDARNLSSIYTLRQNVSCAMIGQNQALAYEIFEDVGRNGTALKELLRIEH